MFFPSKKVHHHTGCLVMHIVAAILLFLATLASLVGAYMAHFQADGMYFGTSTGSLALIAFVVCFASFTKQLMSCLSPCDACAMPAKKK